MSECVRWACSGVDPDPVSEVEELLPPLPLPLHDEAWDPPAEPLAEPTDPVVKFGVSCCGNVWLFGEKSIPRRLRGDRGGLRGAGLGSLCVVPEKLALLALLAVEPFLARPGGRPSTPPILVPSLSG